MRRGFEKKKGGGGHIHEKRKGVPNLRSMAVMILDDAARVCKFLNDGLMLSRGPTVPLQQRCHSQPRP